MKLLHNREGEAPAESQSRDTVMTHAAQQELRPPQFMQLLNSTTKCATLQEIVEQVWRDLLVPYGIIAAD